MSRATILVAKADGKFTLGVEYRNAFRGAAAIWNELFRAYVKPLHEFDSWLLDEGKRVWALVDDDRLSADDKIALLITFDYCVIGRDEMVRVADALERFSARLPDSHLSAWANSLRALADEPDVRAAAFHHTSVSENPWWNYPDGEDEDGEPYSLDGPTPRHWFIFQEHPELAGVAREPR